MSDDYIPIKKLSDVHNNEFYPLTAAKGVITTEDIAVKNILGGGKEKIDSGSNLFDILVQLFGTEFNIDTDILTDKTTRVVSSFLLTKILGGNSKLKFKICKYSEYKEWLDAGTIDDDTLYFTIKEYWKITLDANGGVVSPESIQVEKGRPYGTLPVPSYSGNVFLGWFTEPSGGVLIESTDIPTSDTTLYAQWTSNDDLLCIEENHSSLVSIEEDKTSHIKLTIGDLLKLLSTETDIEPIVTEDFIYNIDLSNIETESMKEKLSQTKQDDSVVTKVVTIKKKKKKKEK